MEASAVGKGPGLGGFLSKILGTGAKEVVHWNNYRQNRQVG